MKPAGSALVRSEEHEPFLARQYERVFVLAARDIQFYLLLLLLSRCYLSHILYAILLTICLRIISYCLPHDACMMLVRHQYIWPIIAWFILLPCLLLIDFTEVRFYLQSRDMICLLFCKKWTQFSPRGKLHHPYTTYIWTCELKDSPLYSTSVFSHTNTLEIFDRLQMTKIHSHL